MTEHDGTGSGTGRVPPLKPSPAYYADPYPFFRQLRDQDPLHRSALGPWLLSRYDDCMELLRDPRFLRDKSVARANAEYLTEPPDFFERMRRKWMVYRDPPDHTRLRQLFGKAFTPRMVQGLSHHVEGLAKYLLDEAEKQGGMEVVSDLSFPLPIGIIAEMLGVPVADRNLFRSWSRDFAIGLDLGAPNERVARADAAAQEFHEYLSRLIAARQRNPRDDLVTALLGVEAEGEKLNREEMVANCVLLMFAGHETTSHFLTNGLLALLDNPQQLALLRAQPGLMKTALEELLRYEAPLQITARFPAVDLRFRDREIRRGEQIIGLLGAANRDPRAFPDPDRLDLARRGATVMTFGAGIHYCLGAPLARLEGQVVYEQMLGRFPQLRLAPGFAREYRDTMAFRALRTLPVLT